MTTQSSWASKIQELYMSVEHLTSVHALSVVLGEMNRIAFQEVFGFHNMSTGVKKLIVVYDDSTSR